MCIRDSDADVVIADDTHSESNGNLALFFEIPNVATSRSAESSGVTTEGSKEEYAVKSLTVYLFDSTTKTLKDQQELKNINRTVTVPYTHLMGLSKPESPMP